MKEWQKEIMARDNPEFDWEQQNASDPCEDKLVTSAHKLHCALNNLDDAIDWVYSAQKTLEDTPMEIKLGIIIEDLNRLNDELINLKNLYSQGKRE